MVNPLTVPERLSAEEAALLIRRLLPAPLFFRRGSGPKLPPPIGAVLFGFLSLDFPTGRVEAILLPGAKCDEFMAAIGVLADLCDLAMAALFALAGGLVFGYGHLVTLLSGDPGWTCGGEGRVIFALPVLLF